MLLQYAFLLLPLKPVQGLHHCCKNCFSG